MCDAIARGKLRVLIGLLLGVFVIASFEAAQASAASGGEPVTVAKKKKKKKCKKGYKRFGKKCYKKRSGSFTGTASISLFKIVPYSVPPGEYTTADEAVQFEATTSCGPTGTQTVPIGGPPSPGSTEPFGLSFGIATSTSPEFSHPAPGDYSDPDPSLFRSYNVFMQGDFNPSGAWANPKYLATSATGWYSVTMLHGGTPECNSGQIAFQVSQ